MQLQRAMHADGQYPLDIGGAAWTGNECGVVGSTLEPGSQPVGKGKTVGDNSLGPHHADMIFADHGGKAQFLAGAVEHQGSGFGDTRIGNGEADIDSSQLAAKTGREAGKTVFGTTGGKQAIGMLI
jgi:hypothetical protein